MIYLGFLLHIYQPPQQTDSVLRQISNECYRPLLRLINSRSDTRFTLNLNWSLTERWLRGGYQDLVDDVRQALDNGRIEMTSSAAYHAIIPLIPRSERVRQVLLNDERNGEVFGKAFQPRGFFPPEMAYGPEVVDTIRNLGYRWTITDDTPFAALHGTVPGTYVSGVEGFPVLLRSAMWSNRISMERGPDGRPRGGREMAEWLERDLRSWFGDGDGYVVLAMDGETFGHHHKGTIETFLLPFLDALAEKTDSMRLAHLSDIAEHFPVVEMSVPPGSWSTNRDDFFKGDFYPLWKGRANEAHSLLWELTEIAHTGIDRLHQMLDQALNSCTFWWVAQKPGETPLMTVKGIDMLLDLVRLGNPASLEQAEAIRSRLLAMLGPLSDERPRANGGRRSQTAESRAAAERTSTEAKRG